MVVVDHPRTCPCDACVVRRARIRDRSMASGQRLGWNAHSLDDPRHHRNELTFTGTRAKHLHEQETPKSWGTETR